MGRVGRGGPATPRHVHRTRQPLLQFSSEIRDDLAAGISGGEIRPDIDIEGTILALIAMLRGAGLHMIIRSPAPDRTARMRDTILASMQRSLAARPLPAHSIYFGALTGVRGCGIHA